MIAYSLWKVQVTLPIPQYTGSTSTFCPHHKHVNSSWQTQCCSSGNHLPNLLYQSEWPFLVHPKVEKLRVSVTEYCLVCKSCSNDPLVVPRCMSLSHLHCGKISNMNLLFSYLLNICNLKHASFCSGETI